MLMYYWVAECEDGAFNDESENYFETEKEAYNAMRNAAFDKMKWNTEYDEDFEDDDSEIFYEVEFHKDKIIHRSYSGIYTYEIKRKNLSTSHNFKSINASYTGGGVWLFYGELNDETYFLMDDYGGVLILDSDPSDLNESVYVEWQMKYEIKELYKLERQDFCLKVLKLLMKNDPCCNRNGIADNEIEYYKNYMMED